MPISTHTPLNLANHTVQRFHFILHNHCTLKNVPTTFYLGDTLSQFGIRSNKRAAFAAAIEEEFSLDLPDTASWSTLAQWLNYIQEHGT